MTEARHVSIPLLDLAPLHHELRHEMDVAIAAVINRNDFVLGTALRDFEYGMSAYLGTRHAIGVASGTDALLLALRAAGIQRGDEVITTAFTFFGTVEAIIHSGATPVFADIDPDSLQLDPNDVRKQITSRTRAVLPVHLFGGVADVTALAALTAEYGLTLIEDAAQACGARRADKSAGTFGLAGCFSFHPAKTLGALGDGGMIVTNDDDLATRIRLLRNHGTIAHHRHALIGNNSRLDDIQAAVLHVKLRHLDAHLDARIRRAENYFVELDGLPLQLPLRQADMRHLFAPFTIRTRQRDRLQESLADAGIGHAVHYPLPVYRQTAMATPASHLPATEDACNTCLSLPLFHGITDAQQQQVVDVIRRAFTT